MPDNEATEDGWCGGFEVHTQEGRMTNVLGPDGEPVRYLKRNKIGFDMRPKSQRTTGKAKA